MATVLLKVKSSVNGLVTNYEAMGGNARRYVGRSFDPTSGPNGGWVLKTEPEEIPYRAEYMQAIRDGDLIPADKATADYCGVKFNK